MFFTVFRVSDYSISIQKAILGTVISCLWLIFVGRYPLLAFTHNFRIYGFVEK